MATQWRLPGGRIPGARHLDALVGRWGDEMLAAVDRTSSTRWDAAVRRARDLPGAVRPDKLRALVDAMSRDVGVAGGLAGAAAVAPGVGGLASLAAAAAETSWFIGRAGDLVLTIAALHGRAAPTVDERRAWLLAVLLYGSTARDRFARAAAEAGTALASPAAGSTLPRLPIGALRMIDRGFQAALVQRFGTRRGVLVLGRALPLGVGAAIGASANVIAIRALARHADEFFRHLPYSSVETTGLEVAGSLA